MRNPETYVHTATATLDFSRVSREVRSLVARRRELMVFLGSLFVALSIYLNNLLHGGLPPALANIGQYAFFTYALMLLVPSILIALRIMRLHGGMTINGVFYQHILATHGDPNANPLRSSRLNWSGISTGLFLLTVTDTVLAAALFALSFHVGVITAIIVGICSGVILLLLFLRNHIQASKFALDYVERVTNVNIPSEDEVEDHHAQSLQDANQDMTGITAFVALILFSVMENLSGLGEITNYQGDIAAVDVIQFGPLIYTALALITAIVGMQTYRRLAIAAGDMALKLDPTDDPFAPLRLTDTMLGYLMLCVLFGISLHLMVYIIFVNSATGWWLELVLNLLMVVLYPFSMWQARSRQR